MNLGRRFYIGIPGYELDSKTKLLLKEVQPGGVILFGRNVHSAQQIAKLSGDLRKLLGSDLLICLDHEGGRVNRLKDLIGVVPSAMQLGFLKKNNLAHEHGRLTGHLLKEMGVNVNLAPVLDLWLRPKTDNSVPDRCWSRNPHEVARLAGAFLESMQKEGVMGCGKHFLGYGAADKDPHLLLPRVNRTHHQIFKEDLFPYAKLLPLKVKSQIHFNPRNLHLIMLSHAHLRAFHGNHLTPACISPKIVTTLLRQNLGFHGVTITDDLEMGAITRTMTVGQATVKCLQLGVDLVLICHTADAIREGFRAAQKAFQEGLFPDQILQESYTRIKRLQQHAKMRVHFSKKRFMVLTADIHRFTKKIFSALPPSLRIIDERWGPIGEKYGV